MKILYPIIITLLLLGQTFQALSIRNLNRAVEEINRSIVAINETNAVLVGERKNLKTFTSQLLNENIRLREETK